ncbi:MAG: glycosyltransferase [Lachnospiraceae bacterium]|nr:glycosyltransferase [Lachnospiraceae bacterium]
MKRLLYFTSRDMTSEGQGINKKITEQVNTFGEKGFHVDAVFRKNVHELVLSSKGGETLITDKLRPPYKISASKYLKKYIKDKMYDYVYIRYVFEDYQFHSLLKILHKKKVPIVIEIPTYPYDAEFLDSLENKVVLAFDKIYRKRMWKYVDRIATFSKDQEIWGIPTIQMTNGLDFSKIRVRNCNQEYNGDINIIAVADLAKWHGYDRIINGIGEYYKGCHSRNIIFHLVGSGAELENYKLLVEKWNITDHVHFYGRLQGERLDNVYDKCNLAAECFGGHRKGLELSSSLKSREYMAKGLPIISSINIDVFLNKDLSFFYKFEGNESPIDMEKVVEFCDSVYSTNSVQQVSEIIRNYGENVCDIKVALQPVVKFFGEHSF